MHSRGPERGGPNKKKEPASGVCAQPRDVQEVKAPAGVKPACVVVRFEKRPDEKKRLLTARTHLRVSFSFENLREVRSVRGFLEMVAHKKKSHRNDAAFFCIIALEGY